MSSYLLAIDLGGTTAKCAIINNENYHQPVCEFIVPTVVSNKQNSMQILKNLKIATDEKLQTQNINSKDVTHVSFTVPGTYNNVTGIVGLAPNINWQNFNIDAAIKKIWSDKKINILNDADAAAYGQYIFSYRNNNNNNLVLYILGTGIGGGVIKNGYIEIGADNFSSNEFGHHNLNYYFQPYSNIKCNCGLVGCLETVASTRAINRYINEFTRHYPNSFLAQYQDSNKIKTMTTVHLNAFITGCLEFDPRFQEFTLVLQPALQALAQHILIMQHYEFHWKKINFYLAGGITKLGNKFLKLLQQEIMKLLPAIKINIMLATASDKLAMWGIIYHTLFVVQKRLLLFSPQVINANEQSPRQVKPKFVPIKHRVRTFTA